MEREHLDEFVRHRLGWGHNSIYINGVVLQIRVAVSIDEVLIRELSIRVGKILKVGRLTAFYQSNILILKIYESQTRNPGFQIPHIKPYFNHDPSCFLTLDWELSWMRWPERE